jgi:hypothetical protein
LWHNTTHYTNLGIHKGKAEIKDCEHANDFAIVDQHVSCRMHIASCMLMILLLQINMRHLRDEVKHKQSLKGYLTERQRSVAVRKQCKPEMMQAFLS